MTLLASPGRAGRFAIKLAFCGFGKARAFQAWGPVQPPALRAAGALSNPGTRKAAASQAQSAQADPGGAALPGRARGHQPELSTRQRATRVRQRFQIKVHPRTLEKALQTNAKGSAGNSGEGSGKITCWSFGH